MTCKEYEERLGELALASMLSLTPNEQRKAVGLEPIEPLELEPVKQQTTLEPLTCVCCGGTIDQTTLKCNYCDTVFILKG